MELNASATLSDREAQPFLQQLAIARVREPGLTADALASRLLRKLCVKWTDEQMQSFLSRNAGPINQMIGEIAVSPDRDEKLAGLGWAIVDGVLQRL